MLFIKQVEYEYQKNKYFQIWQTEYRSYLSNKTFSY
jgi:hypothetical protein